MKNNTVHFSHYRQGNFYYNLYWTDLGPIESMGVPDTYQFPVPDDDIGEATMEKEDKAIYFMRWINRALKDNTFIKL